MATKKPSGATVKRQLNIPEKVYYDMLDENTRIKRSGVKENTEETMVELMRDGLKFRKAK